MTDQAVEKNEQAKIPGFAWVILLVVYLASFTAPMAQFKVPPLAGWIIPNFGMDGTTFGLLMSSLAVIGLILAFPASFICRKFGLKTTILISVGCVGIGTLLGAITNLLPLLMFSRMIEGIGIGLVGVAAPTAVAIWFPPEKRGLPLAIWATWFPMGIMLMFNTAPTIANAFGWKSVFWACFVFTVIVFILFALVYRMPEGVSNEMVAVQGSMRDGFAVLKNKNIWLLGVAFFAFSVYGLGMLNTFYPNFLQSAVGIEAQRASSIASVSTLLNIPMLPIVGWLSDKLNKRKLFIVIGLLVSAVSMLLAWTGNIGLIWTFVILSSIGTGVVGGVGRVTAPELLGGTAVGATMAMGVLAFTQNLGTTLGSLFCGMALDAAGWGAISYFMIPVLVVGAVCAILMKSK